MLHTQFSETETLGADLRALRKTRGLTLSDLAKRLGRSVGWLSQVERDLSVPSRDDLSEIASALEVSEGMLKRTKSESSGEEGYVVRKEKRRRVGPRIPGLYEELLSPDLTDDFEMVHSTFAPGSRVEDLVCRPTQEVGYLICGHLDVEIGGRLFKIRPGDSFRMRGEPFRWSNPYDETAIAIWVIAPPVY